MTIEARLFLQKGDFTLDVNFDVPARGVTAVFGHSGCGKTTLLRAIAGLEPRADGYLRVHQMIWQDRENFVAPYRRPIGYVFQEASLFSHLNVTDNILYGLNRVPVVDRIISLRDAVELLGIEHLADRKPAGLSGGERQRVAIARAIAVSPKLLLMDEPLTALDHKSKQEILPYLESLHNELNIPVIYVSHSPDEVARLADHLILLELGRVLATGSISSMLTRLDLPLAQGENAEALIEARVAGHDEVYGLAYLDFPGGRFTVSHLDISVGKTVRLRVLARDVSITLDQQKDTSILNIFPAIVEDLVPLSDAQVMVRLNAGGVMLLSRITRKSATLLELSPGKRVYAQTKSVALLS